MFENIFTPSPQMWTGLIAAGVALPILIHLINMMRHKKIKWAAMEFLLKSHRKNRRWVWLKQLLLLLSRIALLLLALFMLAQVGCENDRVARLLGGKKTHHYVLLDDSFSMGQQDSKGQAFDRAVSMLSSVAARAKNRQNQVFTLIPYSATQPANVSQEFTAGSKEDPSPALLDSQQVDTNFDRTLESLKGQLLLSESTADVRASLAKIAEQIQNRKDENAIVYLISDFRERDWKAPEEIKTSILNIERTGAAVELIDCSQSVASNLAVTQLVAVGNVRAAETPLMMEVTVKNFSATTAKKIQVQVESLEYPQVEKGSRVESVSPDVVRLPTVFIDSIEPGGSVQQVFPVFFNSVGQHTVVAKVENDSLAIDNQRTCVVSIKKSSEVLLIESAAKEASEIFSIVMNPGGSTGISTEMADEAFLRDCTVEQLSKYDTVFLFDVANISETGVKTLEQYVADGGGVVFFMGPNTNLGFFTQDMYRGGEGVFPLPLERVYEVPERIDGEAADIQPSQHPVFAPANSVKNSLLDLVQISQVIAPPLEWTKRTDDLTVEVLATVRGAKQHPLVVSRKFGAGHCVAITTTAGPKWNNWMRNATYLPIMLLLQDFVAAGRFSSLDQLVEQPIVESYPKNEFRQEATMIVGDLEERMEIPFGLETGPKGELLLANLTTDKASVYEIWGQQIDGQIDVRRTAINIDTTESDLTQADRKDLVNRLASTQAKLVDWDKFNPEPKIKPASMLNRLLFCFLILVLVGEQLLAYATNYHR